ncbi:hypothetical protein [Roseateles sp. L2-2]|uniref:hypothetical protein n=1 Tax=Roseateles sp. L2-2 TaxID=3422597 RepID=UPI003D35A9E1
MTESRAVSDDLNQLVWTMTSNSGRHRVSFQTTVDAEPVESTLLCSLTMEGAFWQRDRSATDADVVDDLLICFKQILVDVHALKAFHAQLLRWEHERAHFAVQLGSQARGAQSLSVSVGEDPSLIFNSEKPAFMICYRDGTTMETRWSFVVDQSCVRICIEALEEALGRWKR